MTKHSKYFAPSALSRRIACPGSALLEADLPDTRSDKTRQTAREGSAMHHVCEQCRRNGGEPQDWEGEKAPVEEEEGVIDIEITPDMVKHCEKALAMMREITEGHEVKLEETVTMPDLDEMFGTVDVLVNEPPLLIVCDYKFGVTPVEVEKNAQLMAYALMAAENRPEDYEDIRLVVIQPTVRDENGELKERRVPKVYNILPNELAEWRDKKLMPAVESIQRARRGEAPPEYHPAAEPMTEPCAWCKGNKYIGNRYRKPVCLGVAEAGAN